MVFTQGGVIHFGHTLPSFWDYFRKNEISGNKQDNRGKIWYDKFLIKQSFIIYAWENYGIRVRTYDYR